MAETLTIIGAGYVGAVTGACLAHLGYRVTFHDADEGRLAALASGRAPMAEEGLDDLLTAGASSGRIRTAKTLREAVQGARFAFVAVGTPAAPGGGADLRAVWAVIDALAVDAPRDLAVILRSTVPPGTGDAAAARLAQAGRADLQVVNAPEFLAEGTAVRDFLAPDRLVFGGSEAAAHAVAALFTAVAPGAPRVFVSRRSAELAKYAANAFLAARVSLANEVARIAHSTGADVRDVLRIVGLDGRIGPHFLRPGIGFGGSCFPKDVEALSAVGRDAGTDLDVVPAIQAANARQAAWTVARLEAGLRTTGKLAIWGISFKPRTDDTRHAPGSGIALALRRKGFDVTMHDPAASLPPELRAAGVRQSADLLTCIEGAQALLVATEWPVYPAVDPKEVARRMPGRFVLDGRNCLDHGAWRRAGFHIQGVGTGGASP